MAEDIYSYHAKCIKLTDGDTGIFEIDLGFNIKITEKLRFFGIDCPETRTRNKNEKQAGLKAKQFVKAAIEGKNVEVTTEEKGKFGRYLAVILYEPPVSFGHPKGVKINLNKELIKLKLAKSYFGGKKKAFGE